MVTPQEQSERIAALEAAFRERFFPHVPKVESANRKDWTEDRHDTDRLSRCLAAYVLVGSCNIGDAAAVGALTDGSDDGGIDAFYLDRAGNRLLLVQAKFKRGGASFSQDECLKFINGIRALHQRRFTEFNQAFQDRTDELEEALDTPGLRIEVVLAFLGEDVNRHVTGDLNRLQAEMNGLTEQMSWRPAGLSQIYDWLLAEQQPSTVNVNVSLENWAWVATPRRAVYGQISAASLAALVVEHGTALFERNVRHYLGSVGVNAAIESTVRDRPEDFFYLNNGLTAVAGEIVKAAGTQGRCAFELRNVSIVNGAQTAGAIANASFAGEISPDAKVLITVIEVGAVEDKFAFQVTNARNHQNIVRGIDFAAQDPEQERLRRELAVVGIRYFYRPSAEAMARQEDVFTLEEAAIALACLSFRIVQGVEIDQVAFRNVENAISFTVTAKKEVGRLWDRESELYKKLFTGRVSGVRLCRLVRIYRFIDRILAGSEQAEQNLLRRQFFRHGRYFVMAFVAHRSRSVIERPGLTLSAEDESVLSRLTNELSELIIAQSESLRGVKGYRAIFNNMVDAQPLADGTLERLEQQDTATPAQADSGTPPATTTI